MSDESIEMYAQLLGWTPDQVRSWIQYQFSGKPR